MRSAHAWLAAIFALPAACTLVPTGLGGDLIGVDAGSDAPSDGIAIDVRDSALVPPTPLANGQNGPVALTLDGDVVYWVNFGSASAFPPYSDGSVMRAA